VKRSNKKERVGSNVKQSTQKKQKKQKHKVRGQHWERTGEQETPFASDRKSRGNHLSKSKRCQ